MRVRFRVRTWISAAVVFISAVCQGQSAPNQATHKQVEDWLRSSDPRMVAWGATFAGSNADAAALPALENLAETYKSLPPRQYDVKGSYVPRTPAQTQQFNSMQAVLDALIQLRGAVSSEGIEAILPDFPDQALVLFATLPEPERSRYALTVYASHDRSDQPYSWHRNTQQRMIHMAAAILALHPPPGFTASLLRETTIALKLAVTGDDRERDGWGSVGMCGDSLALMPEPGWPQPFTYVVEEHWPSEQTIERILIDGFPDISFSRARSNSSCSTLSGFTSVQKLRLAQQEAGPPFLEKRGGTLQYDTLRYTDPATFATDLAALIARHRQPFLDLRKALVGKGFIKPAEEASAQPEMEVEIDDQRKDRSRSLPRPKSLNPRTTLHPYRPESGGFLEQE